MSSFKTLVLFYSTWGHMAKMAEAAVEGAKRVAGNEVTIRRIKETLPQEVLDKMHATGAQKAFHHIPEISGADELKPYDLIIFGVPTRYGGYSSQWSNFIDQTGGLWATRALLGKVGTVFSSSATQHGGQETTLHTFHNFLFHQGMIVVGLPYSYGGQSGYDVVKGGSPYGASTIAGSDGSRQPSEVELESARFQAQHASVIAQRLAGVQPQLPVSQ